MGKEYWRKLFKVSFCRTLNEQLNDNFKQMNTRLMICFVSFSPVSFLQQGRPGTRTSTVVSVKHSEALKKMELFPTIHCSHSKEFLPCIIARHRSIECVPLSAMHRKCRVCLCVCVDANNRTSKVHIVKSQTEEQKRIKFSCHYNALDAISWKQWFLLSLLF